MVGYVTFEQMYNISTSKGIILESLAVTYIYFMLFYDTDAEGLLI